MRDKDPLPAARSYIEIGDSLANAMEDVHRAMDDHDQILDEHRVVRGLHPEVLRAKGTVLKAIGYVAIEVVPEIPSIIRYRRTISRSRTPEQKELGANPREVAEELLNNASNQG